MEISWQIINEKTLWEQSLLSNFQANFLQSYNFGAFHERLGNRVWRFGRIENNIIVSFAQVILLKTKLDKFFYIPFGPILENNQDLVSLTKQIKVLADKEKVSFVRFDPRIFADSKNPYEELNLKKINSFTQPQASLVLNLTQSFEQLRSGLSDSTRYNIGWVERKGVRIEISNNPEEDIEIFLELLSQTSKRQGFNLYNDKNYYREQFLSFSKDKLAKLFLAREPKDIGDDVLASAIVIYYADTVTYLHAASSSKHPKLRAPYLMQWKIIEDAKNNGFKNYDFWGVAKDDNPRDPWAGVTAFKKSFGGEKIYYQPPYDLILNKKYYISILAEKMRKPIKKILFK